MLVVAAVAVYGLGMVLVTTGLVSPDAGQDYRVPLRIEAYRGEMSTLRSHDLGADVPQIQPAMSPRTLSPPRARPTPPALARPRHSLSLVSVVDEDDFDRRIYLLNSATLAHGYLVPRPSTDQVD